MADTEETLRQLLDTGTALVNDLGEEAALEHVLAQALALTGARYAALGVLNEDRSGLERFLTLGVDPAVHRGIGDLPRGRGVLGMLIDDPRALLVADVTEHPGSYGFPPGHPAMHTFLGVPILIRESVPRRQARRRAVHRAGCGGGHRPCPVGGGRDRAHAHS